MIENSRFPTEYELLVGHTFKHPIGVLEGRQYTESDIDWIGSRDGYVDIDTFLGLMREVETGTLDSFDQSFCGWNIVMKDGCWFEGDVDWEYGSCFWTFHEPPQKPTNEFRPSCKEDIIGYADDDYEDEDDGE